MKKICWVQHAGEWSLFEQLALRLNDHDVSSNFVCITPEAHSQYLKDGFESYYMSDIFSEETPLPQEEIVALDLKYGPAGIRQIGNSDVRIQILFGDDQKGKDALIARAYKYWEDFFDAHEIDYIVVRETATFATRTAYNVARYRGIPISRITVGPGNDRVVLNDVEETYAWQELLDGLDSEHKILTDDQKGQVEEFIAKRIRKQDKQKVRFAQTSLIKFLRRLVALQWADTSRNRQQHPVRVGAHRINKAKVLKRVIWKYVTNTFFKYDVPQDEKYVYFPFFSRDEAGYLVNCHFLTVNELALVEEVADSLPIGHVLYFKGHPTSGELAYSELRRLRKHPNIRILHPSVSSQDLIEKSDAVFVVHGTSGWEAFLSQKPVVCLGAAYYSYSTLAYKIKDLSDLTEVLWTALRKGSAIYTEKKEEWLWFIHTTVMTSGEGAHVNLDPPYGFSTDTENIQLIAEYIVKKIEYGEPEQK